MNTTDPTVLELAMTVYETVKLLFFIVLVYVVGRIAALFIGFHLETKRIKLLMKADTKTLALEYMRLLKEFVEEYGPVIGETRNAEEKPFLVVLKKKLSNLVEPGNYVRANLFLLLILMLILLWLLLRW